MRDGANRRARQRPSPPVPSGKPPDTVESLNWLLEHERNAAPLTGGSQTEAILELGKGNGRGNEFRKGKARVTPFQKRDRVVEVPRGIVVNTP
mmetsp:Transcript_3700/g.10148  ORF Transcript_3700/g.10148 Transcript_3700/m.10148 type:complete len:93 (+) Transcript_3700:325-603(+)